ncbi:PepSY domain-containing protein [Cryobacterium sp. SO1]|uniref:PepSY domain-containing protein n=1 Tax=Cryobacterium sp. SO1 TaxID=1897061 RepID=UPI0010239F6D|nr:PepSY domain-containing protein [Cryobacterium sp. SO1]RZI36303.1 hypothetical protein BJQ95_01281 [Cryobacterium sp. SO1]
MKKKTLWITGAAVAAVLVVGGAGLAVADPSGGPFDGSTRDKASTAALDAVGSGTGTDAGSGDDAGSADYSGSPDDSGSTHDSGSSDDSDSANDSGSSDDSDSADTDDSGDLGALSAADRDAATAAALATLPAGTVGTITEVEQSDDFDYAYEVEITLDNGQDVDVELDASFAVVEVDGAPTA